MKISGSAVLHAPPERVWQAINDPEVLARVIPGCDALDPLGDGHFGMTVTLGVAAIKGSYTGEVRLTDLVAPQSLTMRANGSGGPGTVDTTVLVTLAERATAPRCWSTPPTPWSAAWSAEWGSACWPAWRRRRPGCSSPPSTTC